MTVLPVILILPTLFFSTYETIWLDIKKLANLYYPDYREPIINDEEEGEKELVDLLKRLPNEDLYLIAETNKQKEEIKALATALGRTILQKIEHFFIEDNTTEGSQRHNGV